jgi:F-type H+-transporting ATPase subunit b
VQIDWVTIVAQIVNFLILVWLLHRVLYRPLSRAIEARGIEVNRRLAEAEEARRAAAAAEEAHQSAIRALEGEREARCRRHVTMPGGSGTK